MSHLHDGIVVGAGPSGILVYETPATGTPP